MSARSRVLGRLVPLPAPSLKQQPRGRALSAAGAHGFRLGALWGGRSRLCLRPSYWTTGRELREDARRRRLGVEDSSSRRPEEGAGGL